MLTIRASRRWLEDRDVWRWGGGIGRAAVTVPVEAVAARISAAYRVKPVLRALVRFKFALVLSIRATLAVTDAM
jgi:hypothetical protein